MNIKKTVAISLLISMFLFLTPPAEKSILARGDARSIKVSTFPGEVKYPFKRLWEKISLLATISKTRRIEKLITLTKVRLAELDYLSENKKFDQIESSASRYSYYAGTLSQEVIKIQNKELNLKIINILNEDKNFLAKLRDRFPANSTYWLAIQQDIDSVQILSEKIK